MTVFIGLAENQIKIMLILIYYPRSTMYYPLQFTYQFIILDVPNISQDSSSNNDHVTNFNDDWLRWKKKWEIDKGFLRRIKDHLLKQIYRTPSLHTIDYSGKFRGRPRWTVNREFNELKHQLV